MSRTPIKHGSDSMRARARWVLVLGTVATGALLTMSAHAAAPPAYAAEASVSTGPYFIGDTAGSVYTFTVRNTGTTSSIGAVEVNRPANWTVTSCPSAPAGWSAVAATTKCRYRSASGTADDIAPGDSATFGLKAKTVAAKNDLTGTWSVVVSSSNHFDNPSLLKYASAGGSGLATRLHSFEITTAVVTTANPAAATACPPENKEAISGTVQTIVVCGRNRATAALTPVASLSSLGGTFVATPGTFASGSIPKNSGVVVLARWSGTTVTGNGGPGKTIVAKVAAATNRTSPLTTLTGYTAINNPPTANADSYTANEDVPLTVAAPGVLANDTDPDGDALTAGGVTGPDHGSVTLNADGSFTYTPDADFHGTDRFTYNATDPHGGSDTAKVTLTVAPTADAPLAVDDAGSTGEDAATAIGVLGNDTDADGDALHVSAVDVTGVQGVVTNHGTHVSYDPNGAFEGLASGAEATETFTYTVSDGALSDVATVTVTITGDNDAPVAVADTATTDEDTATTVFATANDSDAEGFFSVTGLDVTGTRGVVTNNGDGTFGYDPNGAFGGLGAGDDDTDTFTYTITDDAGETATATVTVTITGLNDGPAAVADAAIVGEDSADTAVDVLANDTDADGDALNVSAVDVTGVQGLVTNHGTHVSYDPNGAFEGLGDDATATETFTYTASDGTTTATATVTITIAGDDDAPVAVADTATTDEDSPTTVAASANDSDAEGFFSVTGIDVSGTHGVVTNNGDGTLGYDPDGAFDELAPGEDDTDTFSYTITDGAGQTDTATVTVTVTGVNDPPVATADSATGGEDAAVSIPVLGNDIDAENDALHVSSVDVTGVAGTVTNHGTHVSYDPNDAFESLAPGETATETFTYTASDGTAGSTATVTVTVEGANDAPVAGDDAYQTLQDAALTEPAPGVLNNDFDADASDTKTATSASDPAHGSVTLAADGSFTYTPDEGYAGTDSFTYDVTDGTASDTGTVTITVVPPNAAPAVAAKTASGNEDGGAITVTLTGTDADGDSLVFDAGTASAGLVTVPSGTTCTSATPSSCTATVTYTPNANYNGTDEFTYTAHDGTVSSAPATVTVTVNAVNDAPSFTKGADQTVAEDAPAQSVSNWASAISKGPGDESAQTLSFTTSNTNNSLFSVQPGVTPLGTLVYTPAPNKFGSATVTVSLSDSGGTANGGVDTSPTQTFTITVTPVNDVPIADDDTHTPHEDQLANIAVLDGDVDHDPSDVLTVGSLTNTDPDGNDGVLTVNSDQTVSYDPRGEFDHLQVGGSEVDTFTYTVSDGNGGSDTATVTVTVTGVNDDPTATPKSHTAIGNTLLAVNEGPQTAPHTATAANHLLVGVTDPDDTSFTASAPAASANGGSVIADGDGSFTFLPPQGHQGTDTFTFTVTDAHGGTDTETATVTISDMVWYVDDSAAAGGTGRSTQPFTSLAPISTGGSADAKDGSGDHVFVYDGAYTAGLVMEPNQKLWGQPNGLSVGATALVPAGGSNPVVTPATGDGITLANGADVQRVDVGATGVAANVALKGVSVTNATVGSNTTLGDGVSLTGPASGTISIGSTIVNGAGNPSVVVANRSGGTVTLPGNVTDTGQGVRLQNNTGATVSLTGQLSLTTGTHDAFAATGGGTVSATGAGNTLSTTTGTPLQVLNTTIGAGDLTFRSVTANGAPNGIVLSATGSTGNLVVTGTGTAASGGTIANTTGPAVSLTSTRDVALSHVKLQDAGGDGITGTGVTNLTLTGVQVLGAGNADEERAVDLANMGGTLTISGGTYDDASDDLVKVLNTNTNLTLNASSATFSNQTQTLAGNAFDIAPNGTSAIAASITGNTFSNLKNTSVNFGAAGLGSTGASSLTFTGNTVNGGAQGGAGVAVSGQEATTTTTTISDNSFTGAGGNGVVNHDANDTSTVLATVANNTLSAPKGHGIVAAVDEDADIRIRIDGNTISNAGGDGIELVNFGDDSLAAQTSTAHFVVTNNTVNGHSSNVATQFVGGIGVFHFENDADTTCTRVTGNTVTGTPANFYDIFLQDNTASKLRFEEVPDTAATGAVSAAYIQSKNPGTTASKIDNTGAVYSNGAACTNP